MKDDLKKRTVISVGFVRSIPQFCSTLYIRISNIPLLPYQTSRSTKYQAYRQRGYQTLRPAVSQLRLSPVYQLSSLMNLWLYAVSFPLYISFPASGFFPTSIAAYSLFRYIRCLSIPEISAILPIPHIILPPDRYISISRYRHADTVYQKSCSKFIPAYWYAADPSNTSMLIPPVLFSYQYIDTAWKQSDTSMLIPPHLHWYQYTDTKCPYPAAWTIPTCWYRKSNNNTTILIPQQIIQRQLHRLLIPAYWYRQYISSTSTLISSFTPIPAYWYQIIILTNLWFYWYQYVDTESMLFAYQHTDIAADVSALT